MMRAVGPSGDPGDASLAARCARGEDAAWRELLAAYGAGMRAAAERGLRRGGGTGAAGVDDAVSELCADLLRDNGRILRGFSGRSSLGTWLWVLAYRKGLATARTPGSRPANRAAGAGHNTTGPLPSADPARRAEDADQIARLLGRIETLPARDRLVLTLFHLREWPHARIGRFLGIPEGQVSVLLHRARERLRESSGIRVPPATGGPTHG